MQVKSRLFALERFAFEIRSNPCPHAPIHCSRYSTPAGAIELWVSACRDRTRSRSLMLTRKHRFTLTNFGSLCSRPIARCAGCRARADPEYCAGSSVCAKCDCGPDFRCGRTKTNIGASASCLSIWRGTHNHPHARRWCGGGAIYSSASRSSVEELRHHSGSSSRAARTDYEHPSSSQSFAHNSSDGFCSWADCHNPDAGAS